MKAHRDKVKPYGVKCSFIDYPRIMPALYLLQYWLDPIHIYTSHQPTTEGLLHVKIFFFEKSKIWILSNFFKFISLTLCCVQVIWMLKLVPDLSVYCSFFEFSMMIPLDGLLNIISEFGQNWGFLFDAKFFTYSTGLAYFYFQTFS